MSTARGSVALSFVIPMYNEEAIVRTAIARVTEVGIGMGRPFEVLAVDDGSVDATPEILADLRAARPNLRCVRLHPNRGKPAACKAGLRHARGELIVVLDADLQTPPEVVPRIVAELERCGPEVAAVFGVTSTAERDDPLRLLVGQAVFYFLQSRLSRRPIPRGAGSFFVTRRDVAGRLGGLAFTKGNVGAVMAALGLRMSAVPYVKRRSYRDVSRLGLRGHVEEALGSLALTGVLSRLGVTGALLGTILARVLAVRSRPAATVALGLAAVAAAAVGVAEDFADRSLATVADYRRSTVTEIPSRRL
ncbi:MAG TPA: glycosyltransferase [Actinophytocola sp.]|uniref:glycosyltransferase n=1 Tax=Actinophytocola sp. TaxID=1872138 RepID=UPI002DDD5430|nr:glycosyltransferase [Actinophytocola sp.]HEV2778223.1 glycosyltransferase [Actinophytocola sp.]